MPELPTFDDLYQLGKAEAQARDPRLTDWNDGSALDALTGAGAMQADEVIRWCVARFASLTLDTATGSDLDALALDRYPDLTRKPAAGARGTITLTRGTSEADLLVPQGTRVRGTFEGESVEATVDEDTTWPADEDELDVAATMTTAGPTGNVAAGVFDALVDAIDGDTGTTVSNADRFVGGADEETDVAFRARIKRYLRSLRRGTVAALETGALSVPGVEHATISEAFIAPIDGGYVAVYVGDVDGRGNEALADAVAVELEDWRSAGVWVQTFAATREEVSLSLTVRIRRGVDRAALTAAIRAGVLAYTNGLAPGETLYRSAAGAAAHEAGDAVRSVAVAGEDPEPSTPQNALRVTDAGLSVTLVEED